MVVADDDGDSDDARTLQAAAFTHRIALGPRAGQKLLSVQGAMPREPGFEQDLCTQTQGFGHAAVRCEGDDCQGLERLCRYITRPALAYDRERCNAAGRVVLMRISGHRRRPFQSIVDGVSGERGRCFR